MTQAYGLTRNKPAKPTQRSTRKLPGKPGKRSAKKNDTYYIQKILS
jgi:hypothetical protein